MLFATPAIPSLRSSTFWFKTLHLTFFIDIDSALQPLQHTMSVFTSTSVSHETSLELSRLCTASFPFHGDTCQIQIPSDETQGDHICNSAVSSNMEAAPQAKESHSDNGADLLQCLFCSFTAQTLEQNFFHMFQTHGTFIPEQEHLMNPQGLVAHLSNQINQSHKCISCGSTKTTTPGVQSHMIDRGHCMLSFEIDPLLESFWDFSVDSSGSEEDDQYPGILRERLSSPNHYDSPLGSRVYPADLSLHLPSGQTLGHRSLSRYYRQNLHSKPLSISRSPILGITDDSASTSEALQPSSKSRLQPTTVSKAMIGVPEAKRREVTAVTKSAQRSEWKRSGHDVWAMQRERNRQKFFRVSLWRHGFPRPITVSIR